MSINRHFTSLYQIIAFCAYISLTACSSNVIAFEIGETIDVVCGKDEFTIQKKKYNLYAIFGEPEKIKAKVPGFNQSDCTYLNIFKKIGETSTLTIDKNGLVSFSLTQQLIGRTARISILRPAQRTKKYKNCTILYLYPNEDTEEKELEPILPER